MPISVQNAGTVNVTRVNPVGVSYIQGDEFTDGSVRLRSVPSDPDAHIELRESGVWNDTGIRFSASSIALGRDILLGASCSFLKTNVPAFDDQNQTALIPAIAYKIATGTVSANAPIVDALVTTPIFINTVSETVGTTIGFRFTSNYSRLIDQIFHEVGSVGAGAESCQYSVYKGVDNTGELISRQNIPIGSLTANTTLAVDFDYVLALRNTFSFYLEIVCPEQFSLKVDAEGRPITTFSEGRFGTVGMVTENLYYDKDLGPLLDKNLNPIYSRYF